MDNKIDIEKLKGIELQLLDAFVSACEQLNIDYYILAGTLIGAVRHKGFIPWDDDIDIGMFRKDYDIFLEEGQKLLPKDVFLQTFITDKEYPTYFAKLRKSNTTFIEKSVSKLKMNHGVYLDIFPLDYFPGNKISNLKWKIYSRVISERLSQDFLVDSPKKSIKQKVIHRIANLLYKSTGEALESCDAKLKKMPESRLIRNYFGAWGEKEIWPAEWFGQGSYLEFEGRMVKAPQEWDKLLTHVYGDYMELPPMEKRVIHHYTTCVDLEHSYKNYNA